MGRITVDIRRGDITKAKAAAIVNAANSGATMGGGVARAIRRAGGRLVEDEAVAQAPIPVGMAVATTAGHLPHRYVIHAATMRRPRQRIPHENVAAATRAAVETAASAARASPCQALAPAPARCPALLPRARCCASSTPSDPPRSATSSSSTSTPAWSTPGGRRAQATTEGHTTIAAEANAAARAPAHPLEDAIPAEPRAAETHAGKAHQHRPGAPSNAPIEEPTG